MIKKILITVAIAVIIAVATFGVLYFVARPQISDSTNNKDTSSATNFDLSKNYGACDALEVSFIKNTLGDIATKLKAPMNMGIIKDKYIGDSEKNISSDSQLCIYAFEDGGTVANGFNSGDALVVRKTMYKNDSDPKLLIEQYKLNKLSTEIEGLGDFALYSPYTAVREPGNTSSYKLQVFKDRSLTEYTIRQPAVSTTFTDESAKLALILLAKSAK